MLSLPPAPSPSSRPVHPLCRFPNKRICQDFFSSWCLRLYSKKTPPPFSEKPPSPLQKNMSAIPLFRNASSSFCPPKKCSSVLAMLLPPEKAAALFSLSFFEKIQAQSPIYPLFFLFSGSSSCVLEQFMRIFPVFLPNFFLPFSIKTQPSAEKHPAKSGF